MASSASDTSDLEDEGGCLNPGPSPSAGAPFRTTVAGALGCASVGGIGLLLLALGAFRTAEPPALNKPYGEFCTVTSYESRECRSGLCGHSCSAKYGSCSCPTSLSGTYGCLRAAGVLIPKCSDANDTKCEELDDDPDSVRDQCLVCCGLVIQPYLPNLGAYSPGDAANGVYPVKGIITDSYALSKEHLAVVEGLPEPHVGDREDMYDRLDEYNAGRAEWTCARPLLGPFQGEAPVASLNFGERCDWWAQCKSGICGTGCDCDDMELAVHQPCSCQCIKPLIAGRMVQTPTCGNFWTDRVEEGDYCPPCTLAQCSSLPADCRFGCLGGGLEGRCNKYPPYFLNAGNSCTSCCNANFCAEASGKLRGEWIESGYEPQDTDDSCDSDSLWTKLPYGPGDDPRPAPRTTYSEREDSARKERERGGDLVQGGEGHPASAAWTYFPSGNPYAWSDSYRTQPAEGDHRAVRRTPLAGGGDYYPDPDNVPS